MERFKEFLKWAKSKLIWLLLLPFRAVKKTLKWIFTLTVLCVALYGGKEAYDYHRFAHAYKAEAPCDDLIEGLGVLSKKMKGSVRCVNVSDGGSDVTPGEKRYFVLFLASQDSPTPESTGHGWVIFLTASERNEGGYLIHEFLPTGFGPESRETQWPDELIAYYANVQKHIPASIEPSLAKFLQALYLPMKLSDEGAPQIADGNVVLDEVFRNTPEYERVFGGGPQVIFAAAVSSLEYENAKRYKNKFVETDYRLLINDCTTFVYEVADKVNLYTPPRILNPFPYDSVTAISEMNRFVGSDG